MKSLEEVIKYKLDFLPIGIDPFYDIQTYGSGLRPYHILFEYDIYTLKNTIFPYDSLSFMEDITPLFIYISSCDKYYRENGHGKFNSIDVRLSRGDTCMIICRSGSDVGGDALEEHRFFDVKRENTTSSYSWGSCERFLQPFNMIIKGSFEHIVTEEERLEAERREILAEASQSYSDDSEDEEEEEELSINDFKTFKSDQCVICLEEEPKVLFCNCGHLCICEKCLVRRFDNCLVCKKENTILRIIE